MREYHEFPNGLHVEKLNPTHVHMAWERKRRRYPGIDPRLTTFAWLRLQLHSIVARFLERFKRPRFVASGARDSGPGDEDASDQRRLSTRPWALGPWREFDPETERFPEWREEL